MSVVVKGVASETEGLSFDSYHSVLERDDEGQITPFAGIWLHKIG